MIIIILFIPITSIHSRRLQRRFLFCKDVCPNEVTILVKQIKKVLGLRKILPFKKDIYAGSIQVEAKDFT